MNRIITSIIIVLTALTTMAQGWPEKYDGVMLQGFYWDSYSDSNWANLEGQADEMAQYFNLIWVPNSAYANDLKMNMGYHPVYWFDHKSAFGTEAQLRSMIKTFKAKGTGMIEDVVINHRASVDGDWLNFPSETYKGETYRLTAADICQDDECINEKDKEGKQIYFPTGAKDSGEAWGGARDLDHSGANVQKNVNAYLDFLLNDLGYVGFRYDFVKGFAAKYVGQYNQTARPQYSVGECWDGDKTVVTNWLNGTKQDGQIMSAAFDFPMKYCINDAFSNGGNWSKLDNAALSTDASWARYAVTFVDNHDTGRQGECPLYANVEAANAFILTLPGTPCVWLKHWLAYKTTIKKEIFVRKAAGIHSQSDIVRKEASSNGYVLEVKGAKGNVLLLLGSATTATTGYKLAVEGTCFKMYVSNSVDIAGLDDIKDDTFTAPDCCVVNEGETCAFFEAPTSYANVKCWAWDSSNNYTGGKWPGEACTKVGTNNGKNVWKWTYAGQLTTQPSNIIFSNDGANQTSDLDFANGGYYNEAGAMQGVVTGIMLTKSATTAGKLVRVYTIDGHLLRVMPAGTSMQEAVSQLKHGIYVIDGKKVVK